MNYYERFCGDYSRDTADLSLAEHGAYTVLLDVQYATERGLPEPLAALYRMCRAMTAGEQAAVRRIVTEFFPVGGDGLRWNPRAQREISKWRTRIIKARENGKLGGRPPKPEGNPEDNQEETQGLSEPEPEPNPEAKLNESETKALQLQHQLQQPTPTPTPAPPPLSDGGREQPRPPPAAKAPALTTETWEAYSAAYSERYRAPPVRNAMVSSQLAQVVKRLGAAEAPAVAAWYVGSNNARDVRKGHSVGNLLTRCEKLRTEWATGRQMTETQARQGDRTAATGNVFGGLIEQARGRHG